MPAQEYNEIGPGAGEEIPSAAAWLPALLAAGAAAVGRLPAFGAWWNQDDWGLLARAAGVVPAAAVPVRWLSRTAYWSVMEPLAGLDPHAYTATRLVLFGLAAAGLTRLGGRLGLRPHQQLIAGLLLACSPLAFTPLYWAAGIQELLALATAIWACERWLAGGPGARIAAGALALLSFASKETFLGLPALWAAWSVCTGDKGRVRMRRADVLILAVLALGAATSASLALRGFAGEEADPYARGGPLEMLANLGLYGWYLLSPGPIYAPNVDRWMGVAGWALWAAAIVWGVLAWRRGRRPPAFGTAGALLAIAPALPLARHLDPYLALGSAAFGALVVADLVPRRRSLSVMAMLALMVTTVAWGALSMRVRLDRRDADGLPADPVVRRTAVAHQAAVHLRGAAPAVKAGAGLVLLQPPATGEMAAMAEALGEDWVTGSLLHRSLEGPLGPRLLLGPGVPVTWANGLTDQPAAAVVLVDAGAQLASWGPTPQALLYLTLTDVGRGLFDRARRHLVRAGALSGPTVAFYYDPDAMLVSIDRVRANHDAFLDFLESRTARGPPALGNRGRQEALPGSVRRGDRRCAPPRRRLIAFAASVLSQVSLNHIDEECACLARRDDAGVAQLRQGGATPPGACRTVDMVQGHLGQDTRSNVVHDADMRRSSPRTAPPRTFPPPARCDDGSRRRPARERWSRAPGRRGLPPRAAARWPDTWGYD